MTTPSGTEGAFHRLHFVNKQYFSCLWVQLFYLLSMHLFYLSIVFPENNCRCVYIYSKNTFTIHMHHPKQNTHRFLEENQRTQE